MRRLSGLLLAGAIMLLPAFSHGHGAMFAQDGPQKITFTSDVVLWGFAVNADKTADYERVVAKVKEALSLSERPEARQQLAGWKMMKNVTAQPDGSFVYIHVINPVVRDADYSMTNIVYEVFTDPADQKEFYDSYSGALKSALFMMEGPLTSDFSE